MSLSDPIGDMIARIKNAQVRNHKKVELPSSNFKMKIADILKNEGFIKDFEINKGEILFEDEDLIDFNTEERAHKGIFLSFQYPVEIPGVTVTNFIKTSINQMRKANGLDEMPANVMLKKIREKIFSTKLSKGSVAKI